MAMRFHDRHEWIDYLKACEVARRLVADPSMIADAQKFVAARMLPDPHQRDYALMWHALLAKPPHGDRRCADRGQPARPVAAGNRAVFGKGLTSRDVADLIEHARAPAA